MRCWAIVSYCQWDKGEIVCCYPTIAWRHIECNQGDIWRYQHFRDLGPGGWRVAEVNIKVYLFSDKVIVVLLVMKVLRQWAIGALGFRYVWVRWFYVMIITAYNSSRSPNPKEIFKSFNINILSTESIFRESCVLYFPIVAILHYTSPD